MTMRVQSPKSKVQSRGLEVHGHESVVSSQWSVVSGQPVRTGSGYPASSIQQPAAAQHATRNTQHASAFTLMEAILALSIALLVVSAVGGVFFAALRLRDHTTMLVEQARPLAHAFEIMRNDLQGAMPPQGVMASTFRNGQVTTPNGQELGFQFCTTTGMMSPNTPWGDVQMVTYLLRDSAAQANVGGRNLIRSVTRNLLSTATTQDASDQLLMANVASFDCYCFDGSSWMSSWDSTLGQTNLPVAVRLVIRMAGATQAEDAAQQPYQLVVPLVIQPMSTTDSPPSGG